MPTHTNSTPAHVIYIPYNNTIPPPCFVEHLIFVIFWCSIYFDMAIALLGVTTRLCSVPAKAENISNQHGWRAANILNKPAIFLDIK